MEYVKKVRAGSFLINSILQKIEEKCLTTDQAIMQTLEEYEHEGKWQPLDIRNSLWGTRYLINTTLRMFYARHPEIPSDKQAWRQLQKSLDEVRKKFFKE